MARRTTRSTRVRVRDEDYDDRYRPSRMTSEVWGVAGVLTGGADVAWVMGSSAITTLFNIAQRSRGADIMWAMGEALVGGVLAMTTTAARGAETVGNISLGISVAGVIYLVNRMIPQK